MSDYIEPAPNLSEAWLRALERVVDAGGHAVNVITTITDPLAPETEGIRAALDSALSLPRKKVRVQPVETVAGTIFPHDIYADTGLMFALAWTRRHLPSWMRAPWNSTSVTRTCCRP